MPATPVSEFFNGGLVTSRHGSLLNPGELQRCDDCVYREKDPAIWRAPGRTALCSAFNSTQDPSTHGVKGITHLTFENTRTDQVVSYTGTTLYVSPFTGINGTPANTLSFAEMSGPGRITGAIATSTTFTAGSGFPFLADVVGSAVYPSGKNQSVFVTAVSGQSGSTGHYNIVTLSAALQDTSGTPIVTSASESLGFEFGTVQTLQDNGTTDEILETAQYGATYFAWFGRGAPVQIQWRKRKTIGSGSSGGSVLDDTLVMRPIGLEPVTEAITASQITTLSDGTTPAWTPTLGTGYFWFLATEIFLDSEGTEIEAAYLGKTTGKQSVGAPVAVSITASSGQGVRITLPLQVNTGLYDRKSNHWGIYKGGPSQDATTAPSLATFRRVTLVRITAPNGGQIVDLSDTRFNQGVKYPTVDGGGTDGRPSMTGSANMLGAPDGAVATSKSGSSTDGSEQSTGVNRLKTYGFTTSSPWSTRPIIGIQVQVRGAADDSGNAGRKAGYYLYLTNGTKTSPVVYGDFGSKNLHTNFHGAEMDTWAVAWVTSDLDSNWSVVIGKSGTGSRQRLRIDSVGVFIFWTSGSLNLLGKPYRVVTYRDQVGTTVNEPAAGVIKQNSTACFFPGSFITNDLGDETAIRFSLPGKPEWFPSPYVMRFNTTKRKDIVTCVRDLGQVLIVGMQNSIKRVNYLPREVNTDLTDGLPQEDLTVDHGITGPLCATKFDMPSGGTLLIYASLAGIFLTNGETVWPVNLDLDWSNTVNLAALSSSVMRVYPKDKWITFDYCPAGATHTKNTRRLVFSYALDKVKNGALPCTGPITVSGRSSAEVVYAGVSYLFSGHESDGKIYLEDYGVTQASGYQVHNASNTLVSAPIQPVIKTRKFYPAGLDRDGYEEKLILLFNAYGSNSVTAVANSTRDSTTLSSASAVFASVAAGMRVLWASAGPRTIVLSVAGDFKSCVLSRAANATTTGTTFTVGTGTLGVTIRGSSLSAAAVGLKTAYVSTLVGDLIALYNANIRRGFEVQIEKVPLTFDGNGDTLTSADLSTNMRLHQFTFLAADGGP